MIELGVRARDILSGFEGIVTGRLEHLFRSQKIEIEPEGLDDNGRPKEPVWFEESRCEVIPK